MHWTTWVLSVSLQREARGCHASHTSLEGGYDQKMKGRKIDMAHSGKDQGEATDTLKPEHLMAQGTRLSGLKICE